MSRRSRVELLLVILSVVVCSLLVSGRLTDFSGTDDLAGDLIRRIDPVYQPWFSPLVEPGDRAEDWLFALQAALGAGLLAFSLRRLLKTSQPEAANGGVDERGNC